LRLQFEQLGINQAKMARIIHAVLKSSQYKCSKCGKAGHNSRNCSKKKSKSRRSNKSISKKKVKQKGKSSSKKIPKSRKTKQKGVATSSKAQNKSTTLEENIRRIMLDMLEKVLLPHQLEKLKPENKNLAIPDFVNYREPILEIPESDGEEETLNDPMEIDFVQKKKPISLATIECKIKRLKIPAMVLDSGDELPIISEDIVKRIGWKIDESVKYDLSGVATVPTESIGVARNLPITFPPGFSIHEDFVTVRTPKPTLIFPNPLLKKYKCAVDWGNDKMKIHYNGEDFIIPVTMHKVKNKLEINCATVAQDDKPSVSDQISQEVDSNEGGNEPLEDEWHAPAGFSLDSDNLTLKKNE
ncbi:4228_t:CDS:2, partial [Entrophospora sp. SA101]